MPSFAVDSDGDVEMTVPQPIFELIRAPELRSREHAALIEWHREWERYVEKIRHRCGVTNETFESVVVTIKSSVTPKTLKNMATYVLKKPLSAVTDAGIMEAVQARCRTLKNEFLPDVTSLSRQKLKMDMSIDDCDARIVRYYEDFNGIVEDNGLQGLIGTENDFDAGCKSRLKARCRLLVDGLQPPVLKAQITRLIDLEKRDCKSDDVALFDLILEQANVQQRFHRMSHDYAKKGDPKSEQKPPRAGATKPAPTRSSPPAASSPPAPGRAPRTSRPPPQDGCLVCKGPNWLKDCPTATEAQKADARERFRETKERRSNTIRSKAARYESPAGSVRINGLVEVPYIPDTGADKSIIPQGIVDSLLAVLPTLTPTPLSTRVDVKMADGRHLVCEHEVLLNLELVTIAGPVSIRSVPCLILAGEGEEFLLGRDPLKELGIDIDHQLAQLAGQPLLGTEEDEFPVGDALPNEQDVHDPREVIDRLVAQAVSEVLPVNHVEAVRSVLTKYPDIWSEAIGPDPPAHVEPLRVTLQDDAVPYRSPPRKYAPLQTDFVREYVRTLVANGLVVKNNASRWASAVVPVRKPGSRDKFRMTIDYRPVNRVTIPIAGSMPTNATTTDVFAGKKVFGSFDFTQGFWQLPLHKAIFVHY